MASSLIDLLNEERDLLNEFNAIDKEICRLQDEINTLVIRKRNVSNKLGSERSYIAHYMEKNLIKYPDDDPTRNPEV